MNHSGYTIRVNGARCRDFQSAVLWQICENHRNYRIVSCLLNLFLVEGDQQLPLFYDISFPDMRVKIFSLQIDGIDSDMYQNLCTADALKADGVSGVKNVSDGSFCRRLYMPCVRNHCDAVSQYFVGKRLIFYFLHTDHLSLRISEKRFLPRYFHWLLCFLYSSVFD